MTKSSDNSCEKKTTYAHLNTSGSYKLTGKSLMNNWYFPVPYKYYYNRELAFPGGWFELSEGIFPIIQGLIFSQPIGTGCIGFHKRWNLPTWKGNFTGQKLTWTW